MDLKSVLNGYFEETSFPWELFPDQIAAGLQPRTQPKKAVETEEEPPQDKTGTMDISVTVPIPSKPVTAPLPRPVSAPAPVPKQEPASLPVQRPVTAPKPELGPETETIHEQAQEQAPTPTSEPAADRSAEPVINASAFIKVVRYHHLTGSEFLSLLGNSKISNKAFQEIESNPDLTVKRLVEILEESPLTSSDYEKLIIAVHRAADLKEEAKAKLGTAKPAPAPEPAPVTKPDISPAPKPVPTPIQVGEDEKPAPAPKPAGPQETSEEAEPVQEKRKTPRYPIPNLFDRKEQPDGEENDEPEDAELSDGYDDEEDGEGKPKSNKVMFIVSSIAAVFLIALSFGLRWLLTGSLLPIYKAETQGLDLDAAGIFEVLSELPPPTAPAFAENRSYAAGGVTEESPLVSSIITDSRLLYIIDNTLYIFERIGGQLEQLAAREYGDGIRILGLLELNGGAAVVTSFEGIAYDFTYTIPPETEEDVETVASSTVQRPETVIELLDKEKPESSNISLFGFSGALARLWTEGSRIVAVTSESIPEGAAAQEPHSFMPYVFTPYVEVSDNRKLCPAENVFVPDDAGHSGFVTVFSLDTELGVCSSAAVAGGSGQLVSRSGNDLFIGQDKLLVRYSVSGDVTENGYCVLPGAVGGFSAVGTAREEIRVTYLDEGAAALIVLDNELNAITEVQNLGNGEAPLATCFNGNETYLITETGTMYGINGENEPMTVSTAKVTDDIIYRWSDTVGIRIDALGDANKRTGLAVTAVSLDGAMTELSSLEISSATVADQALDEYLSSPAEADITVLGASPEDGILVIPVVYFDGVSEVERFVICTLTQQGSLSFGGSISEYDRRSTPIFALADNGVVVAVTGDRLITAKASGAGIIGYFSSKPPTGSYSYHD